jgi:hypothetical protein
MKEINKNDDEDRFAGGCRPFLCKSCWAVSHYSLGQIEPLAEFEQEAV